MLKVTRGEQPAYKLVSDGLDAARLWPDSDKS